MWKNKTFRETGKSKHLYRDESDKVCFPHDAAYSGSKYLAKRTISDKILKNRAYEIARNRDYYGYQRALLSMVYKIFWWEISVRNKCNNRVRNKCKWTTS